ncbi:MAG: septum site-determining protein MinC [Lysobacteraceae bacterium]
MAVSPSTLEQAGELKMGQVGIANLRVRSFDIAKLAEEMRERVDRAPKLFSRAAVVVDFGELPKAPDAVSAQALIDALKQTGVLPVALAYGTSAIEKLSQELSLPLLAKFRAQYESDATQAVQSAPKPAPRAPEPAPEPVAAPASVGEAASLMHTTPVRSGQQVYAQGRDLTVVAVVGAGAEVIADGSLHIYGPLRGRALAGAQGNEKARIFCREFHAELVAIAGRYKVIEEVPKELRGKPVQVWLEQDTLHMAEIA